MIKTMGLKTHPTEDFYIFGSYEELAIGQIVQVTGPIESEVCWGMVMEEATAEEWLSQHPEMTLPSLHVSYRFYRISLD